MALAIAIAGIVITAVVVAGMVLLTPKGVEEEPAPGASPDALAEVHGAAAVGSVRERPVAGRGTRHGALR